ATWLGLVLAGIARAQTVVTGTVSNDASNPLFGIKVSSLNGKNETMTANNGSFSLLVNDESTSIVVEARGYYTQTLPITGEKEAVINVKIGRASCRDRG